MIDLIDIVISEVSEATGVGVAEILSDSKKNDIVDARYITVYHCRQLGISLERLASRFGKGRTSIIARMYTQYSSRRSIDFRMMSESVKVAVGRRLCDIENDMTKDIGAMYQHAICTENALLENYMRSAEC